MSNRYKLVLSNKNLYKEVELSTDENELRIGTNIDCQVRLRKDLFFEPLELTIIKKNFNWTILCSDGFYISLGDVRKLLSKDLFHGDSLSINYQNSNNEALHIDFLIDFNDGKIKYERAICIQNASRISMSKSASSNILINSEYARNDQIELLRTANHEYSLQIFNSTYGVYINGKKAVNGDIISNGDFFSLSDCFFYYKNDYLWTETGNRVVSNSFPFYDSPNLNSYPKFVRNTRIKKVLNEEKIEILDPPSKQEKPKANILMKLLPSVGMIGAAAVMAGVGGGMMIIFSAVSAVMGIITAIVGIVQGNKEFKQKEQKRQEIYTNYILNKRQEVQGYRNIEKGDLEEIYISPSVEKSYFDSFSPHLFDRTKEDEDFLCVRLGTGELEAVREINYKKQERLEIEEDLQQKPSEIYEEFKYIHNAPIVCDLKLVNALGIVGTIENRYSQLKNIVFDLVARHHYSDLQMFFIAENDHKEYIRWLRNIPYVYNEKINSSNIVCDDESKNTIFEYLYKEFTARENQKEYDNHILVFLFDEYGFSSHPISKFVDSAKSLDVTFIFFGDTVNDVSKGCGNIILTNDIETGQLIYTNDSSKTKGFRYETIDDNTALQIAQLLAPVYTEDVSLEGSLTKNISLFELLNIIAVDDIDLSKNWKESQVYNSMAAPLGVSKTSVIELDLHDKAHGPHGLVAGTTGSGKSEILQTYILSMITLFHPYEVGFVIIDFKGGGMVNQFKDLPHLLGAITNIDGKEINRSLKSIKAELQKRQRYFASADVNHIDKYIKLYKQGEVKEPLPHLIIIVDEFAELKAEQPEFMKELISAARIGRSLGVHLILATQKPSGQVSEQIWSNSRFKLCLKVQSQEDSNEVLKSPLAAEIREPGRAYLQVGNDEIFELFQSAYSGVSERADDSSQKEFSVYSISESGKRIPIYEQRKEKNEDDESSTQLSAVVNYVIKYCENNKIDKLPDICLPPLSECIEFEYEEKKSTSIIADIGIYDDPENQYQGKYSLNLTEQNIMIIGSALSGKTNLLQTIIRSLVSNYSPEEVNIYIIDFASMVLCNFDNLNHVGGVVTATEDEKLKNLFKLIKTIIDERKEKFLKVGVSSFLAYKEAGYSDLPQIIVFVDNLSTLKDLYFQQDDFLIELCRDGLSFGVSFVIANQNTQGIGYKYLSSFSGRVALFCNDSSEYVSLFDHCREKLDDIHGRCLIEIDKEHYECQIYRSFEGEKEFHRVQKIKEFISRINEKYPNKTAMRIPLLPDVLSDKYIYDNYSSETSQEDSIVIGLDYTNISPYIINIDKLGVCGVCGKEESGKHNFIRYVIKSLEINHSNKSEVYIFDGIERKLSSISDLPNVVSYELLPNKLEDILSRIVQKLSYRYQKIAEGREDILENEKSILLVINNYEIIELISEDIKLQEIYSYIVGKYKNMKVSVMMGGFENKLINYSTPEIMKTLRDDKNLFFFDDLVNLKLFDIPIAYQRQYKKQIETGDCFYLKENDCYKIKTPICLRETRND